MTVYYWIIFVFISTLMLLMLSVKNRTSSSANLDTFITLITILIVGIMLYKYSNYDVVYQKSDLDGQMYLVRDLPDKQKSANMLALVKKNMLKLNEFLVANKNKYKEYIAYIDQLNSRIHNSVIMESSVNSVYVSYSVNKGEEIVFCVRSRENNELHDINLLMYVVLHEMAHVACPEFGHTPLFAKIFAFFATVGIELGLYRKIDFDSTPVKYCGMMITKSVI